MFDIDTHEPQAQSVTATVCEQAALFGATLDRDEFDTRDVWDPDDAIAAVGEAFRIVARAALTGPGPGDIGRAGIGQGAGAAGQKVSDYLIRRAEQYQPVIQLQAGTPVTVVFLEGAWLDGRKETDND